MKSTLRLLLGTATPVRIWGEHELSSIVGDRGGAERVLVAGAGRGASSSEQAVIRTLRSVGWVLHADFDPHRRPDIVADLVQPWPFVDESFDVVISTWVLEHLASPERFLAEACRTLRKNGVAICAVPFIYRKHSAPHDFWRFTDKAIVHLGERAGFRRSDVRPIGGSPFLSSVNLIWPVIGFPLVGFLACGLAILLDTFVRAVSIVLGRGGEVLTSYPMGYVAAFRK